MDRTEEQGLAGRLPISVGGQTVNLRTLNLDESESWQAKFTEFDFSFDDAKAIRRTTDGMLDLVQAYDIDGDLGPDLRKHFTRRELYDAVMQMARAEYPFLQDAPSADKAFGETLANVLVTAQFLPASSTNGRSRTGDSTPRRSAKGSPRKGSSSSGATASNDSNGRQPKPSSRPKSPARTPTPT